MKQVTAEKSLWGGGVRDPIKTNQLNLEPHYRLGMDFGLEGLMSIYCECIQAGTLKKADTTNKLSS